MRDDLARMIKSGHPNDFESDINACMNWQRLVDLMHREMATGIVASSVFRLLLAAILGGQHIRPQFDVEGCNREQKQLFAQLKASTGLGNVTSLGRVDRE